MLIEEGLWGWDPTPGILSVWAEGTGRAIIWRRMAKTGELVREEDRFRPWVLLARRDDVPVPGDITCRELAGPGELRYLVSASDLLRELGPQVALVLSAEEQYLVSSGRVYFRGLSFDQLRRMQFDLETTGLSPESHRCLLSRSAIPTEIAKFWNMPT